MEARAYVESHAREFIDDLKQWLAIPSISADPMHHTDVRRRAADVPSMCTGMRGLSAAEVTLTGPVRDLHSGSFGGGVPNPLRAMAALLAGLHDEAGRVTLPRFYDSVLPLSDEERDLIARLPFDLSLLLRGAEVSAYLWEELASVGSDLTDLTLCRRSYPGLLRWAGSRWPAARSTG